MVFEQLERTGYLRYLTLATVESSYVTGTANLAVLEHLSRDDRFAHGPLHGLHTDVGPDRVDYRSFRGAFGKGSLQIVISKETGRCYCDVDKWNPYADVVGFVGHAFGEVVPHWVRRISGRA